MVGERSARIGELQGKVVLNGSWTHLDQIALRLNQRPRKTLGFKTPTSKLQASVASTV
jgi:IS30 family transposase